MQALVLILFLTACVNAANLYEEEAKQFIEKANQRYFKLYNDVAEKVYASDDLADFEAAFSTLTTVKKIAAELVELSREASQFDRTRIKNDEIKQALAKLSKAADVFVLDDEYFTSILINIAALKGLASDRDIEPYIGGEDSDKFMSYDPDIMQIYKTSNDSEELAYYWRTWRDKNNLWSSLNFFMIMDAFQKASKLMEMTPSEFWYREFGRADFIKDMEKVMEELKPSYQQLHAFIRRQLHRKYGIDVKGPIPDHLFQQVLEQAWSNGSVIEEYFPLSQLPRYDGLVEHFDAKEMIKEADKFYQSLGFDAMNDDFYKNRLKNFSEDEGVDSSDCKADLFTITPNVFMIYCKQVDFKKFMQDHGYLGSLHYAMEKKNLPSYYFESYGLEYPVGEAVILSASTPTYLKKIGLAKNFTANDNALLNRLLRMGINAMLKIPIYFVHSKVVNDFLSGTIQREDVNKYYWKLMEEYVGVEPPESRPEDSTDFPYSFYFNIDENVATQKFVSEVIGYQFYRSFCKLNDPQLKSLHICDFSNNKEVGKKLKTMMALGSKKPWHDVIAEVLPEDEFTINSKALLEYYEPILDWIKAKNIEKKEYIGWTASKKKIL